MKKLQWAAILVVISFGWLVGSGVMQGGTHTRLEDPLQQYYQPMQSSEVYKRPEHGQPVRDHVSLKNDIPPLQSEVDQKENETINLTPKVSPEVSTNSSDMNLAKQGFFSGKERVSTSHVKPMLMMKQRSMQGTADVVPTFGDQTQEVLGLSLAKHELQHVDLNSHPLDEVVLHGFSDRDISPDDKLRLLLLSEMVSWPMTIDNMTAEMLALSHSDVLLGDEALSPMQELDFLALSMMMDREPLADEDVVDADKALAMLTLSDVLADEFIYAPDHHSGQMVLAELALADVEEGLQEVYSDLPAELALLALNDKQYKSHAKERYHQKPHSEYVQPRTYVKRPRERMRSNNDVLQDYRTIDTWSASKSHRTHTSKRHRSSRYYAVPEKGVDKPRYKMAKSSVAPLSLDLNSPQPQLNMETAEVVNMADMPVDNQNGDPNADLDLFAAPILTEDEPMLMADAEMPRDPSGLFSEARLEKVDTEKTGKISGNLFYSTRLKSGFPIVGSRISWKPYDKWVLRTGVKTVLFGSKKDFNYSWGVAYEDWRPGKFSFAINNWGPIFLGQDALKGAKFSIDYNAIKRPTLFGFPISISPALDFPLQSNVKGGWAPTVGLAHTWHFKDNWFARIGVSRKLSAKSPWRWTYGFGRDSWKPFTFNVMYSNWGPNNDFRPNFRKNGRLSVEWKWLLEY